MAALFEFFLPRQRSDSRCVSASRMNSTQYDGSSIGLPAKGWPGGTTSTSRDHFARRWRDRLATPATSPLAGLPRSPSSAWPSTSGWQPGASRCSCKASVGFPGGLPGYLKRGFRGPPFVRFPHGALVPGVPARMGQCWRCFSASTCSFTVAWKLWPASITSAAASSSPASQRNIVLIASSYASLSSSRLALTELLEHDPGYTVHELSLFHVLSPFSDTL